MVSGLGSDQEASAWTAAPSSAMSGPMTPERYFIAGQLGQAASFSKYLRVCRQRAIQERKRATNPEARFYWKVAAQVIGIHHKAIRKCARSLLALDAAADRRAKGER